MPADQPGDYIVAISLADGRAIKSWPGKANQAFNAAKVRQYRIFKSKGKRDAIRRAESAHAGPPVGPERTTPMQVRCDFCGRLEDSVEAAVEANWIPSYHFSNAGEAGDETADPVCSDCVAKFLAIDPVMDEFTVRPDVTSPRLNQKARDRRA